MDISTLDFESFWDTDFSLSKLSPLEYVMDERFELQSVSIKINDEKTQTFIGLNEVTYAIRQINWKKMAALGHNMSGFDAYVLAYRLGINPRMWMCTLAMARPIHAKTTGLSLAKLVEFYKLGKKDNTILLQTKGRRLKDFTADEVRRMRIYNGEDSDQCRGVFKCLLPHYTSSELWQIDALIRMRTEPAFVLNVPMLEAAASIERDRKHKALLDLATKLGITFEGLDDEAGGNLTWGAVGKPGDADTFIVERVRTELASAPKFSALLTSLGVEVPMKAGKPGPEGEVRMIPALAKTDQEFIDLQEHEDPVVAAAARARLDVKSTLLETRIQKFLTAGEMAGGKLPVPLRYCGADTTGRDSGEEYNCQNMPRIDPGAPKVTDALRNCLEAPKGYVIGVADQSGIELRVNHFLWRVAASMAMYQASPDKADLYKSFAAKLYKILVDEVTKQQRQVGKVAQLGLGFGAGAPTFQRVAWNMGKVRLPLFSEDAKEGEIASEEVVSGWRAEYQEIAGPDGGWKACARGVLDIARGVEAEVDPWGLVHTSRHGFVLPSGRIIRYPDLRQEDDGEWPDGRAKRSWFYGRGRHKARITGPKADENIVQALARDSIFDCAVDFYKATGLRPKLRVHDELVYVFPEKEADQLLALLQKTLRTPPRWWPELVVWSEGDIAHSYGAAK